MTARKRSLPFYLVCHSHVFIAHPQDSQLSLHTQHLIIRAFLPFRQWTANLNKVRRNFIEKSSSPLLTLKLLSIVESVRFDEIVAIKCLKIGRETQRGSIGTNDRHTCLDAETK